MSKQMRQCYHKDYSDTALEKPNSDKKTIVRFHERCLTFATVFYFGFKIRTVLFEMFSVSKKIINSKGM